MADMQAAKADEGLPLGELHRQFEDYQGQKSSEINEQILARRYMHMDQWSEDALKQLKARKQPPTTTPVFTRKINGFAGTLMAMRTDPKAFARTPQHEQGSELVTAALRYVWDDQNGQGLCGEGALRMGFEAITVAELSLEPGPTGAEGDYNIALQLADTDTFFYDPTSVRSDFSDASYMGVSKWMAVDEARRMFPDKKDVLSIEGVSSSDLNIRSDRDSNWVRVTKKQVRVVEHWYRQGNDWFYCFYSGAIKLKHGKAFLKDEKGNDICRFLPVSANTDHEGDRYSFFRGMRSLIDEINHRNSKALHLLNSRRIKAERGAFEDAEKARAEAARPDGFLEMNPGFLVEFEDGKNLADMQGQLEMVNRARTEIENYGPNPALVGQGVEQKSGRAIALMQQAGLAELGPYIQAWKNWKLRIYRAIWYAIRAYWSAERWIRVTDDQGLVQMVQVNGMQQGPFGTQMVNALGNIDTDIILEEGPDHINMQADALEVLQAAQAQGQQIPPTVMLELMPISDSIKKTITGKLQEASQPSPQQQQAEQLQMEQLATQIEKLKTEADAIVEKTVIEREKLEIERERLEVEKTKLVEIQMQGQLQAENATKPAPVGDEVMAMLEQLRMTSEAITILAQQNESLRGGFDNMARVMSAPRRMVRDPVTGRADMAVPVLEQSGAA